MRVLLFCHVANDGGISAKTCELAHFLAKGGHEARTVFFKQAPSHYLLSGIDHAVFKRMNPLTLSREVREYRPDLVVLAYSSYLGLGASLRDPGVPVMPIVHGQGVRFYSHGVAKRKVLGRMAGQVLRSFPAVIVLNKDLKEQVSALGVGEADIHILPNGVDTGRFRPKRVKKEFDLVLAGSLYREKRLDILFEALRLLGADRKRPPSLLVLGTGPMAAEWKEQARGLNVTFGGWKQDIWNQYPRARVFVLSSDSEEFPSAPLEAMACGLPVAATRVGSLPGVVKAGFTGHLVEPGRPKPLARAIAELLDDRDRAARMGEAGRKRVAARYGWDIVVKGYIKVFERVMHQFP